MSLLSARSVMGAMDREKYEVVPIGITKAGHWVTGDDPLAALSSGDEAGLRTVALLPDPSWAGLMECDGGAETFRAALLARLDVVFPVLHGTYGEDGAIQGLLELADVPYVGAGVLGSALGMDKVAFKSVMQAYGFPIADYLAFKRREWEAEPESVLRRVEARLGYPVFTKPANLGSSVGISKCHDRAELEAGLAEAARYDRKLLVEAAVPAAREIEVSVLGNDEPVASVPGEIVPSREFYSYEAKYLDGKSELLIPAPLPEEVTERVRDLAVRAYRAIDGAGMARVDFLLSGETGELYVNELNTIPGFTEISMYPKLWEASGLPYPQLIDRLIELALERHRDRARSETSYRPAAVDGDA